MDDKEKKQFDVDNLDLEFFPSEGATVLSTDQLKEINKKLPKWDILPPDKYNK